MKHQWDEAEIFGNPSDLRSISSQRCRNCGAVRYKRVGSRRYGRTWKYKRGSKFMRKVYLPDCDGKHGMFVEAI